MSIATNRYPHVRATLCHNVEMAKMSRQHNNSNLLVLGAILQPESELAGIVYAWLDEKFPERKPPDAPRQQLTNAGNASSKSRIFRTQTAKYTMSSWGTRSRRRALSTSFRTSDISRRARLPGAASSRTNTPEVTQETLVQRLQVCGRPWTWPSGVPRLFGARNHQRSAALRVVCEHGRVLRRP